MKDAISCFAKVNSTAPQHIILFREGISQGQLKERVAEDISFIKKGISEYDPNIKMPNITYIVLNKKNNVKLFNHDSKRNEYSNCEPGIFNI